MLWQTVYAGTTDVTQPACDFWPCRRKAALRNTYRKIINNCGKRACGGGHCRCPSKPVRRGTALSLAAEPRAAEQRRHRDHGSGLALSRGAMEKGSRNVETTVTGPGLPEGPKEKWLASDVCHDKEEAAACQRATLPIRSNSKTVSQWAREALLDERSQALACRGRRLR